ncbi:hypothetical protein L596_021525 [Steinernema carpocapsae]|uniref:UDP-glucuronosyltransferase n=1 Tax=Steinernema carpocapsae TaxID=34508 RepID=A0A4U5MJC7_STECR|nr:hypothetical protein L596_021525 [Steinernema carpocapsae]
MWLLFLAISTHFLAAEGLKIAVFTPNQINSQVIFHRRIAEELIRASHDVHLILIKSLNIDKPDVKIERNVTVWNVDASVDMSINFEQAQATMAFKTTGLWNLSAKKIMLAWTDASVNSCEKLLQNKEFLKRLTDENFDLAFAHMYEYCPIGLIHYAKIPTWIWLIMDNVAYDIGVPSPPSYVPPIMSDASDEMTFIQRFKSQIGQFLFPLIYPRLVINPQTAIFRKLIDPNFPDLRDLGRQCPLIVYIGVGGLGMKKVDAKPLEGEFNTAVDNAKEVVVMTFGSACDPKLMPDSWKDAFMGAFRRFPGKPITLILIKMGTDLDAKKPSNVLLSKWLPQADLLQHSKTAAFISHGGYNGLQEAIYSRTPIITIPLKSDQFRNGRIAVKHGFGYNQKEDISEENVVKALEAILNNPDYSNSVNRMQNMIAKKPVQPEQLLRKWTEFLGEFSSTTSCLMGLNSGLCSITIWMFWL